MNFGPAWVEAGDHTLQQVGRNVGWSVEFVCLVQNVVLGKGNLFDGNFPRQVAAINKYGVAFFTDFLQVIEPSPVLDFADNGYVVAKEPAQAFHVSCTGGKRKGHGSYVKFFRNFKGFQIFFGKRGQCNLPFKGNPFVVPNDAA